MFKNQLQELAQRSCFNLPAYACIREGPDHAPRFKATVNFNGETFESPIYSTTLRQAEHAAAEVALNTMSKRGPAQSLAARILDETGICKNLLQENAQRAGVSLPVYTTTRSGPGHSPVFTSTVAVAGLTFAGDPAKTKKQAEKNAAMAAWSALKQWPNQGGLPAQHLDSEVISEEYEQNTVVRALSKASEKEMKAFAALSSQHSQYPLPTPPARIRVVGRRDVSGQATNGSVVQYHMGPWVCSDLPSDLVQSPRHFNQQPYHSHTLQRGHSAGHIHDSPRLHDSPRHQDSSRVHHESPRLIREALVAGRASAGVSNVGSLSGHACNSPLTSQRHRHEISVPVDEHQRDEEEWLGGDNSRFPIRTDGSKAGSDPERGTTLVQNSRDSLLWSGPSAWWNKIQASHHAAAMAGSYGSRTAASLAPPVRVRSMMAVNAAPIRRLVAEDSDSDTKDGEAATRQVLSQLSL